MTLQHFSLFYLDDSETGKPAGPFFDPKTYSRFKHGCVDSIRVLAARMAPLILSKTSGLEQVVIASSAYKSVPTAAALLVQAMMEHHLPADRFRHIRFTRDHIFPFDYARLNVHQRDVAMQEIRLLFDVAELKDRPLVVIDDALVSGAHERTIRSHVGSFPSRMLFFYLVDMSSRAQTMTEDQMNHAEVHNLQQIRVLMRQKGYVINSRVLKSILTAPWPEFRTFTSRLSDQQQEDLLLLAMSEDYHCFPGAREKMDSLMKQTKIPSMLRPAVI